MADAVSNTSPLQYLHQIERLDVMPRLLGNVVVAPAVVREIRVGVARGVRLPNVEELAWVRSVAPDAIHPRLVGQSELGAGEIETIALAMQFGGLAVLDDLAARRAAGRLGVGFIGTLGLLQRARQVGLISQLGPELDRLVELGFRFDRVVRENLLREVGEI